MSCDLAKLIVNSISYFIHIRFAVTVLYTLSQSIFYYCFSFWERVCVVFVFVYVFVYMCAACVHACMHACIRVCACTVYMYVCVHIIHDLCNVFAKCLSMLLPFVA